MKKITILILLILFLMNGSLNAQTTISPEKEKVIIELISITNVKIELSLPENSTGELLKSALEDNLKVSENKPKLSNGLKEIIRTTLSNIAETSVDLLKESQSATFIEKVKQQVNYEKIYREKALNIYDKYYSLDEINDLIVFYKTPTGQKSLKFNATLKLEIMKATNEAYNSKLQIFLNKVDKENIGLLLLQVLKSNNLDKKK